MAVSSPNITIRSTGPSPLLVLMMVPLTLIGTFVVFRLLNLLTTLALMQGWTIVPATIQKAELSQDGKTQSVDALYTYVVNGKTYTSTRFSLYSADNLGSFFEDAVRELQGYKSRNQPYPLHVNPGDPSQSVLKPVFRLEVVLFYLLFVMLFGALGAATITIYCRNLLRSRREANLVKQYPGEPWKHRLGWLENRIMAARTVDPSRAVSFALYWNAATFPVLMIALHELEDRHLNALTFLVVPFIGVVLILWAAVALTKALRKTYFQLEATPARLGEPMRGRIYASRNLSPASFAALSLRCETYDGDFVNRATRAAGYTLNPDGSKDIWQAASTAQPVPNPLGKGDVAFDVAFDVPPGLPGSQPGPDLRCRWLLAASVRVNQRDLSMEMEIPVFSR